MKKMLTFLTMLFLLTSSSVYAGEIYIKNSGFGEKYVKVFTTDSPNFHRYLNGRFRFRVFVPANLTRAVLPMNGDGVIFKNDDGSVVYTASGGRNGNWGLKESYESAIREFGAENVSYATYGDGWYVVSGVSNGKVHYMKGLVSPYTHCSFHFEYPYSQKEQYDWMIPTLESNIMFL